MRAFHASHLKHRGKEFTETATNELCVLRASVFQKRPVWVGLCPVGMYAETSTEKSMFPARLTINDDC